MGLFGDRSGSPADLLVVGLGNPGAEYEGTRHNVGAATVALLAERHNCSLKVGKERALSGETRVGEFRLALAFPQTFMNDSGIAVRALMKRHGIEDLTQLVVIHDELDLETGRIQVKLGGGIAGHNGLRSIVSHVKSQDFGRIRIGVGRPQGTGSDYVLKRPGKAEGELLSVAEERAADAVDLLLANDDYAATMNEFNTK